MPDKSRRKVFGFRTLFPLPLFVGRVSAAEIITDLPLFRADGKKPDGEKMVDFGGKLVPLSLLEIHGANFSYYYDD